MVAKGVINRLVSVCDPCGVILGNIFNVDCPLLYVFISSLLFMPYSYDVSIKY